MLTTFLRGVYFNCAYAHKAKEDICQDVKSRDAAEF